MKIDLHCHSHYSDGQLSPAELVLRAQNMQVDVLALTDHDTVAGIDELIEAQTLQKRPMSIVPGVEISTLWHGFDIHVLGLGVAHQDSAFLQRLSDQSQVRQERALKIAEKLAKCGVPDCFEMAQRFAGKGQISRSHFARALVSQQIVNDAQEAFKRYLGKGKKAHVKANWMSIEDAVKTIHDAKGQAVLAHPGHYDMTAKWLRRLVSEFAQAGGDGMEVNHPHLAPSKQQLITELALQHNLKGSSGSDFHFPSRWTELGKNLQMPDAIQPLWHNWTQVTGQQTPLQAQ